MSARGSFNSFLNTADPVETERRNRIFIEEAFQKRDFNLVRVYQSKLGLPPIQRLASEGPAPSTIQEPEQPELPPTVSIRRERTRERRAPILETPPTTQEPRSQTPERAPSLVPQPPLPP